MGKKPELSGSEVLKYHQEKLADSNRHGHSAPPDAVWWGYFARTTWSGTSWHAAHIAAQHDTISCQDCCAAQCSPDTVHVKRLKNDGPNWSFTIWFYVPYLTGNCFAEFSAKKWFAHCLRMLQGESRWIKVNQGESRWIKVNQGESRWIKVNQGELRWIKVNQGEQQYTIELVPFPLLLALSGKLFHPHSLLLDWEIHCHPSGLIAWTAWKVIAGWYWKSKMKHALILDF